MVVSEAEHPLCKLERKIASEREPAPMHGKERVKEIYHIIAADVSSEHAAKHVGTNALVALAYVEMHPP